MAHGGHDGLRVELNSFYAEFVMPYTHNLTGLGPGAYFQSGRNRLSFDYQRMVSSSFERAWKTLVNGLPVMKNLRALSVHWHICPYN